MAVTRDSKKIVYRGRLDHIAELWPASSETWDARVDEDGVLTLTHKDGSTTLVRPGHAVWVRERKLHVSRYKAGEEPSETV